jgi:hypothetical protein
LTYIDVADTEVIFSMTLQANVDYFVFQVSRSSPGQSHLGEMVRLPKFGKTGFPARVRVEDPDAVSLRVDMDRIEILIIETTVSCVDVVHECSCLQ